MRKGKGRSGKGNRKQRMGVKRKYKEWCHPVQAKSSSLVELYHPTFQLAHWSVE